MTIRKAAERDVPRILEIYNQAVAATTATFDTEPRSLEDRLSWFRKHGPRHPVLVAEEGGAVRGWASLSPWSDRSAYDASVEISVYVDEQERGKGIGRALMEAIVAEARALRHHTVLARITADNPVSIHLHEALGFSHAGTVREVGFKFGRWLDVVTMQIML